MGVGCAAGAQAARSRVRIKKPMMGRVFMGWVLLLSKISKMSIAPLQEEILTPG
jgi:hypothetical protein